MRDSFFKRKLVALYEYAYEKHRMLVLRTKYRIPVLSPEKTIQVILEKKSSLVRFGDGEFKIMLGNADIGFQKRDPALAENLFRVLDEHRDSVMLCVPGTFNDIRDCNDHAHRYWIDWGRLHNNQVNVVKILRKHCGKRFRYGDTEMTRPYIDWKNDQRARKLYPLLKQLWDGQDLLFVEGEQTRLGIGNDLFDNARSIQRILAPATNAFASYNEILSTVIDHAKDRLVLIALGPTATVLANDLDKNGIRALDIGHVDIEYEWFRRGVKSRVAIEGKYTNEIQGGNNCTDCADQEYLSQIIARIGC